MRIDSVAAVGSIKGVFILSAERRLILVAGGDLLQQHTAYYKTLAL